MPFRIEYGTAGTLMGYAQAAGRADRRMYQQETVRRATLAADAAAQRKSEVRLRAKAQGLQSAAAARSERFREAELGLRERGMSLSEKREARTAKAATEKQAIVTGQTSEALNWLQGELAAKRIDQQAFNTVRVGILTGNRSLVSSGMSGFSKRRVADEKQRAKAIKDAERYHTALNNPRASAAQKQAAATEYTKVISIGTERWGSTWQSDPFLHHEPEYETPAVSTPLQDVVVQKWPANREDLVPGMVYPVPALGGQLCVFTGTDLQPIGPPTPKKKGKAQPRYRITKSR